MEFDKSVEISVALGFKMTLLSPLLTFPALSLFALFEKPSCHIVKTYGVPLTDKEMEAGL